MTNNYTFSVQENQSNIRIDKFLQMHTEVSRSQIQKMMEQGNLKINNIVILEASKKVKKDDLIEFSKEDKSPIILEAREIELDIVYEDGDLVVINKQAGLTTHPGAGNQDFTLANALLYHFNTLSSVAGNVRPGIVHRLDKDTSGLMIVAKNDFAHNALANQIQTRVFKRYYLAIVWGIINPLKGRIETLIGRDPRDRKKMGVVNNGGKIAITNYQTLKLAESKIASLVECKLDTGRTHQIRVHMNHIGHSIIGDPTYGGRNKIYKDMAQELLKTELKEFTRQALHSYKIEFIHPVSGQIMEFQRNPPKDIEKISSLLF